MNMKTLIRCDVSARYVKTNFGLNKVNPQVLTYLTGTCLRSPVEVAALPIQLVLHCTDVQGPIRQKQQLLSAVACLPSSYILKVHANI